MASINLSPNRHQQAVGRWLLVIGAMIFIMIVLGGLTRLTHSGLSMVQWRPLTGWLPPIGEAQWLAAFEDYKQYPEFTKVNPAMTLAGYKSIFWLEYIHRLWGRIMGLAFLLPLLFFWRRGWLDRALIPKLVAMFVLGGLQGVLGWYMVKSGMVNNPDVSHLRLTAHLGAGCFLIGYVLWVALDQLSPRQRGVWSLLPSGVRNLAIALGLLVPITLLSGGLVAGLNAGFVNGDFPFMSGQLIPEGMLSLSPVWSNFLDNVITVQFQHRLLGLAVALVCIVLWGVGRRLPLPRAAKRAFVAMLLLVSAQVGLGIATLLFYVPTSLAALHQACGLLLFCAVVCSHHALRCGAVQRAVRVELPISVSPELGPQRASA